VVKDDTELMAYCICQCVADECSVLNLAVDPEWQRQGLARHLLNLGLTAAQAQGAQHAFLEVRQSNRAAQALYAHFGFALVGLRENYYPVQGNHRQSYEHALLMGLDLSSWEPIV
jgi:ribosomal-protein-alanine N-acetyltransferase